MNKQPPKNQNKWAGEEINILKEKGPFTMSLELSKLIENHSPTAIAVKCRRLGIFKTKKDCRKIH